MSNNEPGALTEREEIEALLPWHAAGALTEREARRVEAALAADPMLARSYEAAREELAEVASLNETLPAPTARMLDRLFAKLDAEPVRRPPFWRGFASNIAGLVDSFSPRVLALAGAAAALVVMVEAGVIGGGLLHGASRASGYVTASAGESAPRAGAFLLVRFSDDASMADVAALLEARHASIVAGPMADGYYKVRVAATAMSAAQLAPLAAQWQSDKAVTVAIASK